MSTYTTAGIVIGSLAGVFLGLDFFEMGWSILGSAVIGLIMRVVVDHYYTKQGITFKSKSSRAMTLNH